MKDFARVAGTYLIILHYTGLCLADFAENSMAKFMSTAFDGSLLFGNSVKAKLERQNEYAILSKVDIKFQAP